MLAARRRRVVAVVAACALVLAGCGGQVGNAATVDGTAITTDSLLAQSAQLSGVPAGTLATARLDIDKLATTNRTLLSREVQHEILSSSGLDTTPPPDQLAQLVQNYSADTLYTALLATPETLEERVGDLLAFQALVTQAVTSGTGIQGPVVDVDVVTFSTLAEGQRAYNRYLIDPSAMTADFDEYDGRSVTLSIPHNSSVIPVGVFSAPVGTVILLPSEDGGALVVKVTGARVEDQGVTAETLSQLQPEDLNALGALLLSQQMAASGGAGPDVQVNPRFGTWDGDLLQVVAETNVG